MQVRAARHFGSLVVFVGGAWWGAVASVGFSSSFGMWMYRVAAQARLGSFPPSVPFSSGCASVKLKLRCIKWST
ncbi:hypothetical protein M885DRAFT_507166 [Pelagophyceae sp. CCMP2097]|nr:hypothetical protein M885DRAFT_507166 [Pelagophyceae sp. CCMP2097]